jgi:uncharacterized lipoprotein YmbA
MKTSITMLLILLCASCSMPHTKIYSLSLNSAIAPSQTVTDAGVDIVVHSPHYLDQPYIGVRKSPYQLDISRYSKWDSSPSEVVREAFGEYVSGTRIFREVRTSRAVPRGFYALVVHLKKFERRDNAEGSFADLAFTVKFVSPEGRELYQQSFSRRMPLTGRSFLQLAEALSKGLSEELGNVRQDLDKVLQGAH